ncbi:MAG: hypothetical protein SCK57_11335 [Bacillota bacterium]|nr:hypothetical protein [Bacillota bacterium]MDW7678243.1 hypothetical protein [Bacillota bacterium]
MDRKILRTDDIGVIQVIGEKTNVLPMWAMNHYITEFCNNYNKIILVQRICLLIQSGYNYKQFIVAKRSAEPIPQKSLEDSFNYSEKKFISLDNHEDNYNDFWHIIFNYVRPVVFVKDSRGSFQPLMDFDDVEAIKIIKMSYNSPPWWDIRGAINSVLDIANAKIRKEMEEEKHIAIQIEQGAKNYESIARASQVIDDSSTPNEIKEYAKIGLEELLEKQAILNNKLGIRVGRIDKKV